MLRHHSIMTILALLTITVGSWCSEGPAAPRPSSDDEDAPSQATVCLGMCSSIQKLCANDIANGEVAGRDLKDGILEETSCQLMCEAEWDDNTFNCVSAADDCSQFLDAAPYCVETEEENQTSRQKVTDTSCKSACRNYAQCAGYGDDATAEDKAYANESCMQICGTWTTATRTCIASTPIRSKSNCAAQTMCMMNSLQKMTPRSVPRR